MKIATLINNIGPGQKSFYLIKEFNQLSKTTDNECAVFLEIIGVPVTKPLFPCFSVAFFAEYNGIAIATTLEEASIMLKTSNNADKYLYLWDIEWLDKVINHKNACKILRDDRLKIIARSESHAKTIENYCNIKPIGVVDDWNRNQLKELLESQNA